MPRWPRPSSTTEPTPSAISSSSWRRTSVPIRLMIIPCIDLMDGKVVQLVQGRDKALEGDAPLEMLRKFAAFPEIQVIDLDAAMGKGENSRLVELLAARARCRVGGGVRTADRARRLIEQGAHRVIVGTAAFTPALEEIAAAVGAGARHRRARFQGRQDRRQRLAGSDGFHRRGSDRPAGALSAADSCAPTSTRKA